MTGLTRYGQSAQTIAISEHLQQSAEARAELRRALDAFDRQAVYSGQRFDEKQHLGFILADFARSGLMNGKPIPLDD